MINAVCTVMRCSRPANLYWSTGESEAEYADWDVCPAHHAQLRSGQPFATHSDLPNSPSRWIIMGADLEVREADAMQEAKVSFEYTASGKEMEIEVTTGKETFDMILDLDQAVELGEAVADMTATAEAPVPDPDALGARA